jgi:hypothetical protein
MIVCVGGNAVLVGGGGVAVGGIGVWVGGSGVGVSVRDVVGLGSGGIIFVAGGEAIGMEVACDEVGIALGVDAPQAVMIKPSTTPLAANAIKLNR